MSEDSKISKAQQKADNNYVKMTVHNPANPYTLSQKGASLCQKH